jgi:hypothetical protein
LHAPANTLNTPFRNQLTVPCNNTICKTQQELGRVELAAGKLSPIYVAPLLFCYGVCGCVRACVSEKARERERERERDAVQ